MKDMKDMIKHSVVAFASRRTAVQAAIVAQGK
jgi:hypothetical protein